MAESLLDVALLVWFWGAGAGPSWGSGRMVLQNQKATRVPGGESLIGAGVRRWLETV